MLIVKLKNIQSIEQATYKFRVGQVTQISGRNNEGKSIVVKTIDRVVTNKIKSSRYKRVSLIREGCENGVIIMSWKNKELAVVISPEPRDTRYRLRIKDKDNNVVKEEIRSLSTGGTEDLVREFGFLVIDDKICLQIFQQYEQFPLITTSPEFNFKMFSELTVDKVAEAFLTVFKEDLHPKFKKVFDEKKAKADILKGQLDSMVIDDVDDLERKVQTYEKMLDICSTKITTALPNTSKLYLKAAITYINQVPDPTRLKAPTPTLTKLPLCGDVKKIRLIDKNVGGKLNEVDFPSRLYLQSNLISTIPYINTLPSKLKLVSKVNKVDRINEPIKLGIGFKVGVCDACGQVLPSLPSYPTPTTHTI